MELTPLTELGREQDAQLEDGEVLREAKRKLFAPRPASPSRWLLAAAAIAIVAIVGVVAWPRHDASALSFDVDGKPGTVRTWMRAEQEIPLRFSDGSSLVLRVGAHARVAELSERGADVALERGSATVAITPREDARWTVAAGPYDVLVTGTRFDVSWAPDVERFRLVMHEGSVEVSGPTIDGVRVLVAGQTMDVQRRHEPTAAPPASASAVPAATPSASTTAAPSALSPEPSGPDWRALASKGDFKEAWALAEPQFGALLGSGSASELASLADVARYAGKGAQARQAYEALRGRHPGTPQAARAAYSLGMMSFGGNKGSAVTWFRTYLGEAPNGALAREALGRILEAQQGSPAAEATARQYLQRYPKGPHAALAKSVLGEDG